MANSFSKYFFVLFSALVLFLVIPLSLARQATAVGESIRVLSSTYQVDFPKGIAFRLEAEAASDIVDVRLFYRVPGSSRTYYAMPQFQPGRQITATYNLETTGAQYIPPGSTLEYTFAITDAAGETRETETASFLYLDNRFNWRITESGPLRVAWHDLSPSQAEIVLNQSAARLNEMIRILGLSEVRSITGVIYNGSSEARPALPASSSATENLFVGFAFPENRVFVGVGMDASLIVHETTHVLLRDALNAPGVFIPAWLNEGLASFSEPRSRVRKISPTESQQLPLRHMASLPGTPRQIGLFYRKSESVVQFMVETYGPERFRAFLDRLNKRERVEAALQAAYRFNLEGLERRWLGLEPRELPEVTPTPTPTETPILVPTPSPSPVPQNTPVPPVQGEQKTRGLASGVNTLWIVLGVVAIVVVISLLVPRLLHRRG